MIMGPIPNETLDSKDSASNFHVSKRSTGLEISGQKMYVYYDPFTFVKTNNI